MNITHNIKLYFQKGAASLWTASEVTNGETNVHRESHEFSLYNIGLLPPSLSNCDCAEAIDQLHHEKNQPKAHRGTRSWPLPALPPLTTAEFRCLQRILILMQYI